MQPRDCICDWRQTSHFGQEIHFQITLKGNLSAEKGWKPDWKRYRDPLPSAGLARWPEASSFGTPKGPPSEARCATLPNAGAARALAGWCHWFKSTAWTRDAPACPALPPPREPWCLAKPGADAARSSPAFALAGLALTQTYPLIWFISSSIFPVSCDPKAGRSESPAL